MPNSEDYAVAKFSIYRIDTERFGNEKNPQEESLESAYIKYLESLIEVDFQKNEINIYEQSLTCIFFTVRHEVDWKNFIVSNFEMNSTYDKSKHSNETKTDKEHISLFETQFPSYMLITTYGEHLYVMTSGKSNSYIDEYKDKLFGLDVFSRLVKENDAIIRLINEKRVHGKRNQTEATYRTQAQFSIERHLEAIYSKIGATVQKNVLQKLGIPNEPGLSNGKRRSSASINFGQGIGINVDLNSADLMKVIQSIEKIVENETPNFIVNYLVPVDKKGVKQKTVFEDFYDKINSNPKSLNINFDNDLNYFISNYRIINSSESPVDLSKIKNCKYTKISDIETFSEILRCMISNNQNASAVLGRYELELYEGDLQPNMSAKYKLKDLLDQEHTYKGSNMFLSEGKWYKFIDTYVNDLKNEFNDIISYSKTHVESFYKRVGLNLEIKKSANEEDLKAKILKEPKLINADKALYHGVEIADAIHLDKKENSITILHNKTNFDRKSVSTLLEQIKGSSVFLGDMRHNRSGSKKLKEKYKNRLLEINELQNSENKIDTFFDMLSDSDVDIRYIANFTEPINAKTRSDYLKYTIKNTRDELSNEYTLYVY